MRLVQCCGCGKWYRSTKALLSHKIDVFESGVVISYDLLVSKCPKCGVETETKILLRDTEPVGIK
jgi:hypothetical protein